MKPIFARILAPAALLGATLLPLASQADPSYGGDGPRQFQGARPDFQGGRPDFRGVRPDAEGGARWSGDVDDTVIVYIHRRDVQTQTRSGKSVCNVDARLFGFLPDRPVSVYLRRAEGRGHVRVIQQPSPQNDWTAAVRLHDPQPGRAHYAFELGWSGRAFDGDGDRGDGDRG